MRIRAPWEDRADQLHRGLATGTGAGTRSRGLRQPRRRRTPCRPHNVDLVHRTLEGEGAARPQSPPKGRRPCARSTRNFHPRAPAARGPPGLGLATPKCGPMSRYHMGPSELAGKKSRSSWVWPSHNDSGSFQGTSQGLVSQPDALRPKCRGGCQVRSGQVRSGILLGQNLGP
jgi:hypothetical protein